MLRRNLCGSFIKLLLLNFIFIAHAQYGGQQNNNPVAINKREELTTRIQKSEQVLSYMNLEADPCADFFEFACGNWSEENSKSLSAGEIYTVQMQMEEIINKELQIILNEPIERETTISERKVKNFYSSCVKVEAQSPQQKNFQHEFIKKHGGLPLIQGSNYVDNYDWIRIIANLRANYGLEILIGLEIDTNLHSLRGNSIYLTEPKTTLMPADLCSSIAAREADTNDELYDVVEKDVANNLKTWLSFQDADANRVAGDIVKFEFELCKHMRKAHTLHKHESNGGSGSGADIKIHGGAFLTGQQRLNGGNRHQNLLHTRNTLQQWTQIFHNVINFKSFVDTIFDYSVNDFVYMRSESYFHHLSRLVQRFSKATLANYIMYNALTAINFPAYVEPEMRSAYCAWLTQRYFPKLIGDMYKKKFYRIDLLNEIERIYKDVRGIIENAFDNAVWLSQSFKQAAIQKSSRYKIRFNEYDNLDIKDLQIEQSDYWHKLDTIMKYNAKQQLDMEIGIQNTIDAPDVNLKLMDKDNEIIVGLGFLQTPLYHFYYPNAIKYALLGQRIVHELVTAFDKQGWNNNPANTMRWDDFTAQSFHNHSECYRMQYSNYLYNNPDDFRNASKLREFIADSNGVNIAFKTYMQWLSAIHPTERAILMKETLTDVNFTNTQLFFISFAQARCAAIYREQPVPDYMPLGKHTNERFVVNGPLANSEEFAREFACTIGTEMNPADKCNLYEV